MNDTTTTTDTADQLTPAHPIVTRLVELQGTDSNEAFAKRWLGTVSGSSWGRIRNGDYHAADHGPMTAKLESALASLEQHHAASGGTRLAGEIVACPFISLGLKAVKKSFTHPRNRLVVALAPTGGGKTTLGRQITETYHGRVIQTEATETWRKSYLKACHDILAAAGVADLPHSVAKAETDLLDRLKAAPKIIIIDEAHYFGPQTINLVKAILNQTKCSVVILAIPTLWNRMKRRAWEEAEQLRTRTCALIDGRDVHAKDVATYLDTRLNGIWSTLEPGERKQIADAIAERANKFGRWNTVETITDEIIEETAASRAKRLGRDHLAAAIATIKALD